VTAFEGPAGGSKTTVTTTSLAFAGKPGEASSQALGSIGSRARRRRRISPSSLGRAKGRSREPSAPRNSWVTPGMTSHMAWAIPAARSVQASSDPPARRCALRFERSIQERPSNMTDILSRRAVRGCEALHGPIGAAGTPGPKTILECGPCAITLTPLCAGEKRYFTSKSAGSRNLERTVVFVAQRRRCSSQFGSPALRLRATRNHVRIRPDASMRQSPS
jgi:hypothetical protein